MGCFESFERENFSGLSRLNIAKSSYSETPLQLILYKPNSQPLMLFSDYQHCMTEPKRPDIIIDDFNIYAYKESRL